MNADRRRVPRHVLPRRRRPRTRPPPQQPPRRGSTSTRMLASHGDPGHRRHRHPPADPAHPRHRRHARRVRRRSARPSCSPPPRREPGTDGVDLVAQVTTPSRYTSSATVQPAADRRLSTSGSSARSCATSPRSARVEVVPGSHHRGRRPRPPARTACSCRNGPGDPAMVRRPGRGDRRRCSGSVPIFGICLGHQLLGAGDRRRARSSCRSATTAATTRCSNLASGRIEITSQNHNFAVDAGSFGGSAADA